MIRTEPEYGCRNCAKRQHWGKFSCKKCNYFYTSEYKFTFLPARVLKLRARRESPKELVNVYDWLRDNVFPKGYVLPSRKITFRYQRSGQVLGTCWKGARTIAISTYLEGSALYRTMIHEMLHLRMAHHKKSFKEKLSELLEIFELKYPYSEVDTDK